MNSLHHEVLIERVQFRFNLKKSIFSHRQGLPSTVKLPTDFKPLYESTPKTQPAPSAKQVEIDIN